MAAADQTPGWASALAPNPDPKGSLVETSDLPAVVGTVMAVGTSP